ncbi:EFR1 family ferrodoxin [Candidatus Lokiarchaeum ossiferum]|uniref:EFR1 family ferrodoxin n=1 Tax=Candidatus Lokiarchaeum ossiferum TaxID=2951803 RepID=UPI00352F7DC6
MRIGLIYFSGTGGTAKIANIFGSELKSAGHIVSYLRIKRDFHPDLHTYDLIGIGSPAYSFRAPRFVTQNLKHLSLEKIPFFVFCTSGGMPGNTLWNLYKAVERKAGLFLGYFEVSITTNLRSWMPRNTLSAPNQSFLPPISQSRCKEFIFRILSKLSDQVVAEKSPKKNGIISLWSIFLTRRWQMAATVGIKRLNKRKCNQCTLCAHQICPSGAIQISTSGYPRFNEWKCVGCNGCVNLCPQDAIWSYQVRNHAQYNPFQKYILKKM